MIVIKDYPILVNATVFTPPKYVFDFVQTPQNVCRVSGVWRFWLVFGRGLQHSIEFQKKLTSECCCLLSARRIVRASCPLSKVTMLPLTLVFALAVLVCLFSSGSSYALQRTVSLRPTHGSSSARFSSEPRPELDDATKERIEAIVTQNKVVLFMKGDRKGPKW
jgi:hypothetical protein